MVEKGRPAIFSFRPALGGRKVEKSASRVTVHISGLPGLVRASGRPSAPASPFFLERLDRSGSNAIIAGRHGVVNQLYLAHGPPQAM